jgi:hypothetical protein
MIGGFDFLFNLLIYLFRSAWSWLHAYGSGKWPSATAMVTAEPVQINRLGCGAVEIVYSYRVDGELYTGLQEEDILAGSNSEYIERFPKGTSFLVRVKPNRPEVSAVRDQDQTHGVRKPLEQIHDLHDHKIARK